MHFFRLASTVVVVVVGVCGGGRLSAAVAGHRLRHRRAAWTALFPWRYLRGRHAAQKTTLPGGPTATSGAAQLVESRSSGRRHEGSADDDDGLLSREINARARAVANSSTGRDDGSLTESVLVGGDMLIPRRTLETLQGRPTRGGDRGVMRGSCNYEKWNLCRLWEQTGTYYEIPYVIAWNPGPKHLAAWEWSIGFYDYFTNIRFVPRKNEPQFIEIRNNGGCYAPVGFQNQGLHVVSLGEWCMQSRSTVLHELMHVLSFGHETNRPDVHDHVRVLRQRLKHTDDGYLRAWNLDTSFPYDMASLMQCGARAGSKNGKKVLEPIDPIHTHLLEDDNMRRVIPSSCDLAEIHKHYPGPIKPPRCVPNVAPHVCEPLPNCAAELGGEQNCRYLCDMACESYLRDPKCRLLTYEEIAVGLYGADGRARTPGAVDARR